MARSVLGDEAVADFDDFARFVHRGLDTEGVDDRELRRLYANCLQSRPGSRTAVSDVLSAEKLAESVVKGQWAKHWSRYVGDARQKALDKGPCGASAAVIGALLTAHPAGARQRTRVGRLPLQLVARRGIVETDAEDVTTRRSINGDAAHAMDRPRPVVRSTAYGRAWAT